LVQQAVEWTGMEHVPAEDRTRLASDNGSGYLARVFEDYLRTLAIRHIRWSPHRRQTNGKLERFHENAQCPSESPRLHEPGPIAGNDG